MLENRTQFDLLLTDIVMPEMDGIELAQQCADYFPKTQVMFITGFSGSDAASRRVGSKGKNSLQTVSFERPGSGSAALV